jgi:FPC/CPF motif-containing protein YcgG
MALGSNIYVPSRGRLAPLNGISEIEKIETSFHPILEKVETEIAALLTQRNYPCVAALQSFHRDDYQVGFYEQFGTGKSYSNLRADLHHFLVEQRKSGSTYHTFWAIFPEFSSVNEQNFETQMWEELSWLTSEELKDVDWGPDTTNRDPGTPEFAFNLFGEAFFVVGMHPESSRRARKFPWPTLIFNVFSQFRELQSRGLYDSMVQLNRERDRKFQGTANPMAVEHGEKWETIQFSGRQNNATWKCPFHFLTEREKKRNES